MTFENAGVLGAIPGHRDELVALLTRRNDQLRELGCSLYEVGVSDDSPDTVFVVELWESEQAHRRSLENADVRAAIAAARPILSGEFGGFRFDVVASPLRHTDRCAVDGTFYRAVDAAHRAEALSGSRRAGRYSTSDQPTLYLSSSLAGVSAAMGAHGGADDLLTLAFDVVADDLVDLRDPVAVAAAGIELADAVAPWQDVVAVGGRPSSWDVRDRLVDAGANGLIDPSRTSPGLWHLVLFRWNTAGSPRVVAVDSDDRPGG